MSIPRDKATLISSDIVELHGNGFSNLFDDTRACGFGSWNGQHKRLFGEPEMTKSFHFNLRINWYLIDTFGR